MPWRERGVMDERMSFIVSWQHGETTFAELCRMYGVSRRVGYKWVGRYASEGVEGLKDRSRAPHHHPNAVSVEEASAIIAVRARHPSWGPKKIRAWLRAKQPGAAWPAQSTIAELLDGAGLVRHRQRRPATPPAPAALSACGAANDVWGIDFKGWFRTGDGWRCNPLSLSDLATRYVLRLQALARTGASEVWPILEAAFREFGVPKVIRSDNGTPFASTGAGGLSRLAVRLIKAGVTPERIAPGKPQQNGRHERLHLTVKIETADPPAANRRQQQRRFDAFRHIFNEERPHEALGQTPPAQHYHPAPRPYSGRLRQPDYPDGQDVRRVHPNGMIKWRGQGIFISEVLAGEPIGLELIAENSWSVHYGPIPLGTLTNGTLHKPKSRAAPACGFVDSAEEALPTTPQAPPPPQA